MNGQQRPRYLKDKSGELAQLFSKVLADDQKEDGDLGRLEAIKILFAWRDPPEYDQRRNKIVSGTARRLSARERDLFGYDAVVVMATKLWKELNDKQKYRLMWHEVYHLEVLLDESGEPDMDDHGRIKIRMRPHDLNMERFSDELDKFGFEPDERAMTKKLMRIWKKHHGVKKDKEGK